MSIAATAMDHYLRFAYDALRAECVFRCIPQLCTNANEYLARKLVQYDEQQGIPSYKHKVSSARETRKRWGLSGWLNILDSAGLLQLWYKHYAMSFPEYKFVYDFKIVKDDVIVLSGDLISNTKENARVSVLTQYLIREDVTDKAPENYSVFIYIVSN